MSPAATFRASDWAIATTLEQTGEVQFEAKGGSMWPSLRSGTLVQVNHCTTSQLKVGDIALADTGASRLGLVLHRIVAKTSTGWVLQGDFCSGPDQEVSDEAILGRLDATQHLGVLVPWSWSERTQPLRRWVYTVAGPMVRRLRLRSAS